MEHIRRHLIANWEPVLSSIREQKTERIALIFRFGSVLVLATVLLAACQAGSSPASAAAPPTTSMQPSPSGQPLTHSSAPTSAATATSSAEPSASPAPLSRDQAVAIARVLGVHTATSSLVSATAGRFADFDAAPTGKVTEPGAAWVWDVKFKVSNSTDAFVILDYYTGVLVETGLAQQ